MKTSGSFSLQENEGVKVMAGRGRPPKPTAIKELEGNPGKRPLNKNEPKKPKQGAPKCPSWLEPDAKGMEKIIKGTGSHGATDGGKIWQPLLGIVRPTCRWKEAEEFISKAWIHFKDGFRLYSADSPGIYCPAKSKTDAKLLLGTWAKPISKKQAQY